MEPHFESVKDAVKDATAPSTASAETSPSPIFDTQPLTTFNLALHSKRPSLVSIPTTQRNRKRVPWRGKFCIISIPQSSSADQNEKGGYLTPLQVDQLFEQWQKRGHSIDGFELGAQDTVDVGPVESKAQSRPSFPGVGEILAERAARSFQVKIPDQAQWVSYVNDVKEAKLRALGVSSGSEESNAHALEAVPTPARQLPSYGFPSPFWPSFARPHSTDNSVKNTRATSLPLGPTGSNSNLPPAAAFQNRPTSNPGVRHVPRYSMAQPQMDLGTSECPIPSLPSTSRFGMATNTIDGGRSLPRLSTTTQALAGDTRSITDDFDYHSRRAQETTIAADNQSIQDPSVDVHHRHRFDRRQYLPDQPIQQPWKIQTQVGVIPTSSCLKVQNDHQNPLHREPLAVIQQPIPRNHNPMVPLALESSLQDVKNISPNTEKNTYALRHREPANNIRQDDNMALTSNSQSADDGHGANRDNETLNRAERREAPKSSASRLNALAPVFKAGVSAPVTGDSTAATKMRPTAPAFTPAVVSKQPEMSRVFSFSSAGPSYVQDVAVPGTSLPKIPLTAERDNPIFGKIEFTQDIQSTRKSKAVPILRPKDQRPPRDEESEVQEDESGRITQADGRQKRIRRSSEGGLGNAHFMSSATTAKETSIGASESLMTQEDHARPPSISIEQATQAANQLKDIIDELSTSDDASNSTAATGNIAFHNVPNPKINNIARPRSPSTSMKISPTKSESEANTTQRDRSLRKTLPGNHSTSGDSENALISRQSHSLPDHDKLNGLRRKASSASRSSVDDSTSPATEEILNAEAQISSSRDSGEVGVVGVQNLVGVADCFTYVEPSYAEIDAVMKHLNEDDLQNRVRRKNTPRQVAISPIRSERGWQDAAGPSNISMSLDSPHLRHPHTEIAPTSFDKVVKSPRSSWSSTTSRGHRDDNHSSRDLHRIQDAVAAIAEGMLPPAEESQSHERGASPEKQVRTLVDAVLKDRLMPLERTLVAIQDSLADHLKQASSHAERGKTHDNLDISDADDEDDTATLTGNARSPNRDRKSDRLKALIREAISAQYKPVTANELVAVTGSIQELKTLLHEANPSIPDVKAIVEEAVGKQMRGRSRPITSSHQSATVEKNQLQITGLESMLKIAEGRAEDELRARRDTEDALADSQRLLRLALQDAAEQRESAEETERSLSAFHEERHETLRRTAMLEGTQESLQNTVSGLSEKNAALEATLEEYRLSSAQWREEIDDAKTENGDLRRTISALRTEIEDGIRSRQAVGAKFDQLQEELVLASQTLAREQSTWHYKEEEHKAKVDVLVKDYEREHQRRLHLENEVASLSDGLRVDRDQHQEAVAHYERQLHDVREVARLQSDRMQKIKELDNESAASQLSSVHVKMERLAAETQARIDETTKTASAEKAEHERLLQEAMYSKAAAIRERQEFHDQITAGLKQQFEQASHIIRQEKHHIELQSSERLALAEDKLAQYQDKIHHLQERLGIAQSAAQAAVQAVQSKHTTSIAESRPDSSVSNSLGRLPEKTSPRALRESILVLQEQLQDRESRIESLEQRLAAVDTEAPARCKVQASEISWLRELLDVRLDDLEDVITALGQPVYDKEAIKAAAIRLRANMQMEQQEKERAHTGAQTFPSIASISSLTSSPRSFPMAAAAAWGNWRKGRNSFIGEGSAISNGHTAETPSRISPSHQDMLPGLLTPPHTSARGRTHSRAGSRAATPTVVRRRPASNIFGQSSGSAGNNQAAQQSSPPKTPSLTRKASYDVDALDANMEGFQWPELGAHTGSHDEAFGPSIASFAGQET
ncbi:MAG: hypothetical protein Q9174_000264 [Haloplaca sp. 1 TL-2023]